MAKIKRENQGVSFEMVWLYPYKVLYNFGMQVTGNMSESQNVTLDLVIGGIVELNT